MKKLLLSLNLVIDNEWLDKYVELIVKNKFTKKMKFKTQLHHIIPRKYYTYNKLEINNSRENLVNLLYKDHILAHYYLALCAKETWFKFSNELAVKFSMNNKNIKDIDDMYQFVTSLDHIQELYEDYKYNSSILKKGKYGKKHSDETKLYLSNVMKNRVCIKKGAEMKRVNSCELSFYLENGWSIGRLSPSSLTRIKISQSNKKHKHSVEQIRKGVETRKKNGSYKQSDVQKLKASMRFKGKTLVNDGNKCIWICREELDKYLKDGWYKGRLPVSDETRQKLSMNSRNRVHMIKDGVRKMVKKEEIENYIKEGWKYGRL